MKGTWPAPYPLPFRVSLSLDPGCGLRLFNLKRKLSATGSGWGAFGLPTASMENLILLLLGFAEANATLLLWRKLRLVSCSQKGHLQASEITFCMMWTKATLYMLRSECSLGRASAFLLRPLPVCFSTSDPLAFKLFSGETYWTAPMKMRSCPSGSLESLHERSVRSHLV